MGSGVSQDGSTLPVFRRKGRTMILIQGEDSDDWIALVAANAMSWARRIKRLANESGRLPPWASIPPGPGSVVYRNDRRRDIWTFGSKTGQEDPEEGATMAVLRCDCDTAVAAGAGARLYTRRKARIVTVTNDSRDRGHTFETSPDYDGRGYALWDLCIPGGMEPLSREDYNRIANVALIEWEPHGTFRAAYHYGVRPLVLV